MSSTTPLTSTACAAAPGRFTSMVLMASSLVARSDEREEHVDGPIELRRPSLPTGVVGDLLVRDPDLHRRPEIQIRAFDNPDGGQGAGHVLIRLPCQRHRWCRWFEVRDGPLEEQLIANGIIDAERREDRRSLAEHHLGILITIQVDHQRVKLAVAVCEQGVVDVELRREVLVDRRHVEADSLAEIAHRQPGEPCSCTSCHAASMTSSIIDCRRRSRATLIPRSPTSFA